MNWKLFDALRRQSTPLETDLMEAYAAQRISRRDFVRRGTMIGLGVPVMGAVIAACGSSAEETAANTTDTDSGADTDLSLIHI